MIDETDGVYFTGTVAEVISRPRDGANEWCFTVQDHTIAGKVLNVAYQVP